MIVFKMERDDREKISFGFLHSIIAVRPAVWLALLVQGIYGHVNRYLE